MTQTAPALKPLRVTTLVAASMLACATLQAAPLKIALVETLSGPASPTGQLFRSATRYSLDIINASGGWNGEPIQLLEYDNQGGPAGAAEKVKAAIADGAHMIVQGAASSVAGQITEDVRKHNLRNPGKEIVFLNVGGEANEFTAEKCHYFHVRFSPHATLRMKALMGVMRTEKVMGDEVFAINQNYSWGQDIEKATVEYGPSMGYKVVDKVLHDLNKVQDFSPYVAKIAASNADTVVTGNWGNDLLLLMKAAKSAGLKARFATTFLDQPGNIGNAGETALGHYVVHSFNAQLQCRGRRRRGREVRQRLQGQIRPCAVVRRAARHQRPAPGGRGAEEHQGRGRQLLGSGLHPGLAGGQDANAAGRDQHPCR